MPKTTDDEYERQANALMKDAEQAVSSKLKVKLADLERTGLFPDVSQDDFGSSIYDESVEGLYELLSQFESSELDDQSVKTESIQLLEEQLADAEISEYLGHAYSNKVVFTEAFLSGLQDALIRLLMEADEKEN